MVQQGLYQTQDLGLRQEQIIAPHQIQSLEILTVPLLDLQMRVNQEMELNPTLERLDSESEQLAGDPIEQASAPASPDSNEAVAASEKDEFLTNLLAAGENWEDYVPPNHARQNSTPDDEERRRFFFDTLTTEKTLEEELLEQLRTADCPATIRPLAAALIGNLDSSGYLRHKLEELSRSLGCSLTDLQRALKLLQSFEPAGIGARDLRECLLLQLDRQGKRKTVAWQLVDRYLEQVSKNRIPEVARALRITASAVYEAWAEIKTLQPRPGGIYATGDVQYVLPEVAVSLQDGELQVTTNKEYLPQLRIAPLYRQLLEDPKTPTEVKQYVREKITNGNQLIRSLTQRQSTIHRIAEILVERQHEFFDSGDEALKPLTMSQVAEEIETPRGLFPLRHFFASGFTTDDGDALSSVSIKHKIQGLISEEDGQHPLSDQHLAEVLRDQGLNVARRTVAKYREELGIASSHLRRNFNT
jgi:RNA polymerase sigma-54 factor